jgi:hypothetical protein
MKPGISEHDTSIVASSEQLRRFSHEPVLVLCSGINARWSTPTSQRTVLYLQWVSHEIEFPNFAEWIEFRNLVVVHNQYVGSRSPRSWKSVEGQAWSIPSSEWSQIRFQSNGLLSVVVIHSWNNPLLCGDIIFLSLIWFDWRIPWLLMNSRLGLI